MSKKKKHIEPIDLRVHLPQMRKDAIAREAEATRWILEGASSLGGEWIREGMDSKSFRAMVINETRERIKAIRSLQ